MELEIQRYYDDVKKFNSIAGNLKNVDALKIAAQLKVFIEEAQEMVDGFNNEDPVEFLDGICDSFVTLGGVMEMAQRAGFQVGWALDRVNENNLSKFPDEITAADHSEYEGRGWTVSSNWKHSCFVIKDENGKIRKPLDFLSVEIADLVPEVFFGGAV